MRDKLPSPGIVPEPPPEPELIIESETTVDWLAIVFSAWGLIICAMLCYVFFNTRDEKPVMSFPDGPSEVSGQTIMPEPVSCPGCECRDCESGTWLAQFVHHLDSLAENPREIRDVLNRCYTETRLTPSVVSETGDWGICQINRRSWPDVDVERLLVDPEYAAQECLRVYRVYFSACGKRWQDCYRRGVRGSK